MQSTFATEKTISPPEHIKVMDEIRLGVFLRTWRNFCIFKNTREYMFLIDYICEFTALYGQSCKTDIDTRNVSAIMKIRRCSAFRKESENVKHISILKIKIFYY